MRVLVVSDIHGSGVYADKLKKIIKKENPEKIVVLGDLYYHGPRNPLTDGYNPMKVTELLNSLKDKLEVVRGNCDAEVDEMISEFSIKENILEKINGKSIFFSHGHIYNIDNFPMEDFDIMFYGHYHTCFIKKYDNKLFVNPGSISLPKENTPHSYAMIEEKDIFIKDVDGNVIEEYRYKE